MRRRQWPPALWKVAGNQGVVGFWGAMELVGLRYVKLCYELPRREKVHLCRSVPGPSTSRPIVAAALCGRGVTKCFLATPFLF